jgi:hypothetical protein
MRACLQFLLIFPAAFALSGCGLWTAVFPSLPESQSKALSAPRANLLKQLSSSPMLYQVQVEGEPVYLTLIETCDSIKKLNPEASTRRLFVGLRDIEVLHQESIEVRGSPVVTTSVEASYDQSQISLMTLSAWENNCLFDLAFWTKGAPGSQQRLSPLRQTLLGWIEDHGMQGLLEN